MEISRNAIHFSTKYEMVIHPICQNIINVKLSSTLLRIRDGYKASLLDTRLVWLASHEARRATVARTHVQARRMFGLS